MEKKLERNIKLALKGKGTNADLDKLALAKRQESLKEHVKDCNDDIDERERKASLSPDELRHFEIAETARKRKERHVELDI